MKWPSCGTRSAIIRWRPFIDHLAGRVHQFLVTGRRGLTEFVWQCDVRIVEGSELQFVDPELQSLVNVNTPEEYHAALRAAGLAAP